MIHNISAWSLWRARRPDAGYWGVLFRPTPKFPRWLRLFGFASPTFHRTIFDFAPHSKYEKGEIYFHLYWYRKKAKKANRPLAEYQMSESQDHAV